MRFTITEMSLGEILERGVKLFFARLPVFFAIELLVVAPTLILQLALPDMAIDPRKSLVFLLPWFLLGPIGSAAMLRVIIQEYLGQPVSLGEALTFALGRFLPLLGTTLLAGLGIVLGAFACCLPGIYLGIIWAFVSQVVVMENISGPAALGRSKSLVEGEFWRVLGTFLVLGLLVTIPSGAVEIALPLAVPFAEEVPGPNPFVPNVNLTNYANFAIVQVASSVLNALTGIFVSICTTLLYFDLRNRKEAFDVGHIVAWMDQYRDWRDEPDTGIPPASGAAPPQTGIKDTGAAIPPPETGIKDPYAPHPGDKPPPAL